MYCKQCGNKILDSTLKKCPKCNTTIGKGGRFCPDCGEKISSTEPCKCKSETVINKVSEPILTTPEQTITEPVKIEKQKEKLLTSDKVKQNPLFSKIAAQKDSNISVLLNEEENIEEKYDNVPNAENSEKVHITESAPVVKNIPVENIEETKPIKTVAVEKANTTVEKANATVEKANATVEKNNKEVKEDDKKTQNPSAQLFPDAFSPNNIKKEPEPYPTINTNISQNIRKDKNKSHEKKEIESFWVAGAILCMVAFCSGLSINFSYILLGLSALFGILDTFLNKRLKGVGVVIAAVIEVLLLLII